MESVKIGSVGLGRLGYEHAKNLAASIPGCVLHAICNVDTSLSLIHISSPRDYAASRMPSSA